jgi:hypothetical protein
MLKSPAMNEALRPIHHLEAEAAKDNEIAQQAYESGLAAFKLKQEVAKALTKKALKKNGDAKIEIDLSGEPQEPLLIRYRTNDSTYEGLGELLIANPSGILVERDELVSLLQFLDREDQAVVRGFYLSGWSGTQPYTFDRIGRGQRHIEAACVSVLGITQPARHFGIHPSCQSRRCRRRRAHSALWLSGLARCTCRLERCRRVSQS